MVPKVDAGIINASVLLDIAFSGILCIENVCDDAFMSETLINRRQVSMKYVAARSDKVSWYAHHRHPCIHTHKTIHSFSASSVSTASQIVRHLRSGGKKVFFAFEPSHSSWL